MHPGAVYLRHHHHHHFAFAFQSWQEAEAAAGSEVADSWHNVRHTLPFCRVVPDGATIRLVSWARRAGTITRLLRLPGWASLFATRPGCSNIRRWGPGGALATFTTELQSAYDSRRRRLVFRQCGASRMLSVFGRTLLTLTQAGARICSFFQKGKVQLRSTGAERRAMPLRGPPLCNRDTTK